MCMFNVIYSKMIMPYLFHIFKLLNLTFYVFTLQGLGVFYPFVCLTLPVISTTTLNVACLRAFDKLWVQ